MKSPWKRPVQRLPVIFGLHDDSPVSGMDGDPAAPGITRRDASVASALLHCVNMLSRWLRQASHKSDSQAATPDAP
jgi:hypothetical protein